MFGSYFIELIAGIAVLALAALLWPVLLRAFRREPVPAFLRPALAAEISIVFEVALVAVGVSLLIDGVAKAIP